MTYRLQLHAEGDGKTVRRIARRYPAKVGVQLAKSYDAPDLTISVEPATGRFTVTVTHFAAGNTARQVIAEGSLSDYEAKR